MNDVSLYKQFNNSVMENVLYKLMIRNARIKIDSQDPNNPKEGDFNAFQISDMLAMLLCKRKEDILFDIVNCKLDEKITNQK